MIRHSRSNSSSVSSSKCSSQSKVNSTIIELLGQERGNYSNEETNANNCSSLRDENTLKFIQSFLNSNQKDMNNSSYFSAHQATSSTNYLSVWESSIASQHVQSVSGWNVNRLNDLQDAQKVKEKQLDFFKQQLQKEQDKNEENNARILEMIEREEATKEQLQEQIQEGQGIQRRQGIQEQFIRKEQLIASLKWIKEKVLQKWNSSRQSRENHNNSVYPYDSQNSSLQADRIMQWIKFEELEKREIGSILRALADKEEAFYAISNAEEKLNFLRESIQMNEEELATIQQRQISLTGEYECMESWLDLAKQSSDKMIQQQINLRQVWFCLVQESHNYRILIIQGQDKLKGMSVKLENLTEFKRNIQKIQLQNTNKQNNQAIIWSKNELLEELKAREILKKELSFTGKQALERIEELFSGQLSGKEAVYDAKKIFYSNNYDFLSNESQNNQEKDCDSSKISKQSQEQIQRWKGVLEALQCVVIAEVKDYFDDVMNLRLKQAESDETTIGSSKQKNSLMESSNLQGDLLARCQSSFHVRRELNSLLSELLNIENKKIIAESVKSILIARRGDFSRQFDISANQAEYDWKEGKVQEQLNQISVKIQNQTSIIQQYTHKLDSIVNQLHVLDTQTFPFFQISAPLDMPEGLQFFDDSPNLNLTALNLTYKMPRSSMENNNNLKRNKDIEEVQKNIKNKDSRYYSEQFKRKNQVDQVFKRLAEIQWSNCIDKINLASVTVQLTQNKKETQDISKFIEDKASAIIHLNKLLQRMAQGLAQIYLQKLTEEDMKNTNLCMRNAQDHESNFSESQITRDCSAETLEKILGKDENMADGMSFLFSGETLNPGVKLKILNCELERNERERMSLKKKQEELVLPLNLEISKYDEMICNLQNQAHQQQLQFQQNPQGNQQQVHNGNYNPQQQQQVSPGSMGIEKGRNLTLSDITDITNEQQQKFQYSSAAGGVTLTPSKQDNPVLQSSLLKMRGSNSLSSKQQTITSSSNNNNNQFFLDYYKSNQQSCINSNSQNPSYVERRSHLNNQSSNNNSGSSIGSQRVSSSKILRQFLEFPLINEDKENLNGNQQEFSQEMQIFKKFQINSGNLLGKSGLYDVLDCKQKHPLFCGYGLRTVKIEGDCFLFVNSKTKQIELSVKRNESNNVFLPPVTFDIIKAKLQYQSTNSQCLQQAPLPMSQTTKKLLEVQFIPIALELKNKGRIECLVESLVQLKQLYGLFRCFIENNHPNFNTFS